MHYLPKYCLWMLCDIFEATNKFETGSFFDVFFSRAFDHGFGFCKRKRDLQYKNSKSCWFFQTEFSRRSRRHDHKRTGSIKLENRQNLKSVQIMFSRKLAKKKKHDDDGWRKHSRGLWKVEWRIEELRERTEKRKVLLGENSDNFGNWVAVWLL